MFNPRQKKTVLIYVLVQLVIWVKCFYFYSLYGHGQVLFENPFFGKALFGQPIVFGGSFAPFEVRLFDFVFHILLIHFIIALLALSFGKNIENLEWKTFIPTIFVAVFLHNFGYWLTFSHPSLFFSAADFIIDFITLSGFVLVSFFAARKFAFYRNFKFPFIEPG